jgi:hypothetical protein
MRGFLFLQPFIAVGIGGTDYPGWRPMTLLEFGMPRMCTKMRLLHHKDQGFQLLTSPMYVKDETGPPVLCVADGEIRVPTEGPERAISEARFEQDLWRGCITDRYVAQTTGTELSWLSEPPNLQQLGAAHLPVSTAAPSIIGRPCLFLCLDMLQELKPPPAPVELVSEHVDEPCVYICGCVSEYMLPFHIDVLVFFGIRLLFHTTI